MASTPDAPAVGPGLPDYCCAILVAPDGRLLLEWRGPEARRAANRITCLGGEREPGEDPEAAVRRELREEIGWVPDRLERRVTLEVVGRLTAWFYRATFDGEITDLVPEPGVRPILLRREELDGLPVAPWHKAVLDADARGVEHVRVEPT
jgi:8-oxo-dGTP pyrophosphatase MutT (NUDIX family)